MEKRKVIGIASGINPLPSLKAKAWVLATASDKGVAVDVVESGLELPATAPTPRIAEGDRKITAFLAARELERAGCDAMILADIHSMPFLAEIQREVQIPVISLFAKLAERVQAEGVRKVALLGKALPRAFYEKLLGPEVEVLPTDEAMLKVFSRVQDPATGLRKAGLTPEFRDALVDAGEELVARGAELLIPNCTQMARFVEDLRLLGLPLADLLRDAAEVAVLETPAKLPKPFKVGMIGGLGPAATVDLYDKIVKATPARIDQEHIKLVVEQNPQIPDRTACLLSGGVDPTLALYNCARRMEEDGCDALIIPCNTAHAFIPYIERFLKVPFINMQQAALDEIAAKLGEKARIGLLATTGTVRTGIYGEKAKAMNLAMFTPGAERQERVMAAIYGPKGAKAGYTDGVCREDLLSAAEELVREHDCNCLILGCTELPLILDESDDFEVAGKRVVVIDPTAALARRVVRTAEEAFEKTGVR